MRKKTRKRSYKNTIAIGIASFASIALLSTGLAAFVLIRDAQKTVDGNFVVAKVTEASINLNITSPKADETPKLILDAEKGDKEGRVQIDSTNPSGAVLKYTFKGNVKVAETKTIEQNLELYYIVNIKNAAKSVVNDDFTTEFIETKKLDLVGAVLPTKDTPPVDVDPSKMPLTLDNNGLTLIKDEQGNEKQNEAEFEFTFGFKWGAKYGNINPSQFFDSTKESAIAGAYGSGDNSVTYEQDNTVKGANIPDNVVQQELLDLKEAAKYTFEIVVYAKNK